MINERPPSLDSGLKCRSALRSSDASVELSYVGRLLALVRQLFGGRRF